MRFTFRKPGKGRRIKFESFNPPKVKKLNDSKFLGIATKFIPHEKVH